MTTREARATAKGYLAQIARGDHPRPKRLAVEEPAGGQLIRTTLQSAWTRYRDGHLERKQRSAKTVEGDRDHVERIFESWLKRPLEDFGNDPGLVAREHDRISSVNGPYLANAAMRTFRAIYNHARKTDRRLPAENPVAAIDWNLESRRNTALGQADLGLWFSQLAALSNPVRREFHLFCLLSGCRPEAITRARISDVNVIQMYPDDAQQWLFPADSAVGHISEHREDRATLSKWGNDLRQSFRTLAQAAGVSELNARLLMNHSIGGVNSGYITRQELLEDHLRRQQETISKTIMIGFGRGKLNATVKTWS